jgi:hypothetical protein
MKITGRNDRVSDPEGRSPGAVHIWHDSGDICTLRNSERCCGIIVNAGGEWLAFDATRMDSGGNGFVFLGARRREQAAKRLTAYAIRETRRSIREKAKTVPAGVEASSLIAQGVLKRTTDPLSLFLLDNAAFMVESAMRHSEWPLATRLIRKLVARIQKIGISTPEPQRWSGLEDVAREIGGAVMRRDQGDSRTLFERYEVELRRLLECPPAGSAAIVRDKIL